MAVTERNKAAQKYLLKFQGRSEVQGGATAVYQAGVG